MAPYLADAGWDVVVYGRRGAVRDDDSNSDARILSRVTPGLETKSLSTLSYGLTAASDTAKRRPDVALVMNVANGFFLPLLRARGVPTVVNVDGIEWERAKWSALAKRVFYSGALCTARWSDNLVFDSRAIESYWNKNFGASGSFIPYGGDVPPRLAVPEGFDRRAYVLIVARFVPENSVPEFFAAVPRIARQYPVVIVGSSGYGGEMDSAAAQLAEEHPAVRWLGHVSDDRLLLALWQHAGVYFHGHSVGGTNPALVQAMAAGAPVLARDTVYNREVLGKAGEFVEADPLAIADSIIRLMDDSPKLDRLGELAQARAVEHYSWQKVCSDYESLLTKSLRR